MGRSLLVNFVYCHPVGHAIEAVQRCYGHHLADPDLRIGLVLNAATPVELAELCPFVSEVHAVPVDVFDGGADFTAALAGIGRDWDLVVEDERASQPWQRELFPGLARYFDQARAHFRSGGVRVGYRPGHLRLPIPPAPRGPGARIAVLPGGSAPRSQYPSTRSWRMVLGALADRFPGAEFLFVGKLRADGRTASTYDAAEFAELAAAAPRSVSAVDRPLVEQLAEVAAADVLVSPHSGFAMAALAVGTPWLTISGNRWPEYYFPGVPFYSVLPDVTRYPSLHLFALDPEPVDDDGPRSPSMSRVRLTEDLAEIVEGAAKLVERRWDYDTAMRDHFRRMTALPSDVATHLWSVDDVHRAYLPEP
ncbi:hypothetical protein [Actinosynnema sp. NPDC020468]|uniref:glycosyltransferase family 9 protein n=1 Tax=Actinosynnema sp. NPDC020468 TaxID=3154488 RepID=UPI0033FA2D71